MNSLNMSCGMCSWYSIRLEEVRAEMDKMKSINKISSSKDEQILALKEKSTLDQIQSLKDTNALLKEKNDLLQEKIKFLEEKLDFQNQKI